MLGKIQSENIKNIVEILHGYITSGKVKIAYDRDGYEEI